MHPHEELARREMDLILAGDDEAVAALYAPDFVLHYPGHNPLAGTYTDVGEFLARLGRLFDGGSVERELHDALGTDDHAVQLLRVTGTAKGKTHAWNAVIVMHVDDGQFTEAWFHFLDQYALDEYLTALADD
ncbi:MAG: nuclear transport factor 2 family protein [Acidimicrobiia bacterium]|nr:nuclear transport factor 2 family protein [Acidimicrobiia bacterium]